MLATLVLGSVASTAARSESAFDPLSYRLTAQLRAPGVTPKPGDTASIQAVWSGLFTAGKDTQTLSWRYSPRRAGVRLSSLRLRFGSSSAAPLCPPPTCVMNANVNRTLQLSSANVQSLLHGITVVTVRVKGRAGVALVGPVKVLMTANPAATG